MTSEVKDKVTKFRYLNTKFWAHTPYITLENHRRYIIILSNLSTNGLHIMPSFVIEYGESLTNQISPEELMDKVYEGAKASGHFPPEAIKIRLEPRSGFRLHDVYKDFLHVSGHILSGRTDEQKTEISNAILAPLKTLALESVFVSVEIVDIHRASFVDFGYE